MAKTQFGENGQLPQAHHHYSLPHVISSTPSFAFSQYPMASSSELEGEDEEEYVLDTPIPNFRSRSRFLASIIKKGAHCDPVKYNICNGISANNGTSILHCCKTHCRNTLGDRNNCGKCGHKCKLGQLCCHGSCTYVSYNANHCGKCARKCSSGVKCEYGSCGYA